MNKPNPIIKYTRITNECLNNLPDIYGVKEVKSDDEKIRRFQENDKFIEFDQYKYGDEKYYMVRSVNGIKFRHVKYGYSLMSIMNDEFTIK